MFHPKCYTRRSISRVLTSTLIIITRNSRPMRGYEGVCLAKHCKQVLLNIPQPLNPPLQKVKRVSKLVFVIIQRRQFFSDVFELNR